MRLSFGQLSKRTRWGPRVLPCFLSAILLAMSLMLLTLLMRQQTWLQDLFGRAQWQTDVHFDDGVLEHMLAAPDVQAASGGALDESPEALLAWSQKPEYRRNELLLRQIIEACAAHTEHTIYMHPASGKLIVTTDVDLHECPILDIKLAAEHRGVGMCNDVALYVLFSGARVVGTSMLQGKALQMYEQNCGGRTARLFLENMYPDFVSRDPSVTHIMLPNQEHLFMRDAALHPAMQVWLCKIKVCPPLLSKYVKSKLRVPARVWYMGHSSPDSRIGHERRWHDYSRFLHVRGKSGLKHTKQLLDCWKAHPEFPSLTIVGRMTAQQAAPYIGSRNIVLRPPPGGNLLDWEQAREVYNEIGMHVCPSEREGFGHYINEARAVGAMVLTPDFPPMNELVSNASGVLLGFRKSYAHGAEMALAPYADVGVFMDAGHICKGVQRALRLSLAERETRGRRARLAYLAERLRFEQKMQLFRGWLQARRERVMTAVTPRMAPHRRWTIGVDASN